MSERECITAFQEAVTSAFGYLESEYQMPCRRSSATLIEWANAEVTLAVYLGRHSREIGVELSRRGTQKQDRYSLVEIIGAHDPRAAANYWPAPAETDDQIGERVRSAAALLREHGAEALRGEEAAFSRLRAISLAQGRQFLEESAADQGRRFGQAAAQAGDLAAAAWWLKHIPETERSEDDRELLERVERGRTEPPPR